MAPALRHVGAGLSAVLLVAWSALVSAATGEARREDPAASQSESITEQTAALRIEETVEVVARPIIEETRLTSLGSTVTSVNANQIDDLNAQDFATAVRRVPGVVISRYNLIGSYGGGDGGAIFIRGHGSGRPGSDSTTLIDGIPRVVTVWTHPLLDMLSVDVAQRLDVYKSAQPVLWGNMAFTGVDVIPRRREAPGFETRIGGALGSYGSQVARVGHGGRSEPFDYYFTASHRKSDGARERAGGRVDGLYVRLGVILDKSWTASVQLHGNDAWADDPGRVDAPPAPVTPRFASKDGLAIVTIAHGHQRGGGHAKLYLHGGTIDWLQWDAAKNEEFSSLTDYRSLGVRVRERVAPWKDGELIAGFDHDVYGGRFTEDRPLTDYRYPSRSFRNDGIYVALTQRFGARERLEIVPSVGLRFTNSRDFGDHLGAQAGLVARRGKTELHFNAAHARNFPGIYAAISYDQWGRGEEWKSLRPETLDHFEMGLSQPVGTWLRLDATVFHDDVDDALRFVPPPPPPPAYANIGAYTLLGGELTASVSPRKDVSLFMGVTHLDANPSDVPNAPAWAWSAGASWAPTSRLSLHVDAERTSEHAVLNPRYAQQQALVDASFLLNGKVQYRLPLADHLRGDLYVAGENLTNSDYEYRPGYPMPGRTLFVGLDIIP